jgi:hypothetical protein
MDGARFDTLTRTLIAAGFRRRALGGLLLGTLSLLSWWSGEDAEAHDALKKCKKIDNKAKKQKCIKKAKKHKASHNACLTGLRATDDLQAAVDTATPGATLVLCPGTWALKSTILIAKDLTLLGAGADQTILSRDSGKHKDRDFRVLQTAAGATVTVQDLTITKGSPPGYNEGGGILNDGTLTLRNLTVTRNGAGSGGGIHNNGTLSLVNVTVAENDALAGGGIANVGTATLSDSRVTGNGGAAYFGGGILNGGTMTLGAGSSVSGNVAWFNGGGIYNDGGVLTLEAGSSVTGNGAENGGGIGNDRGTVELEAGSSVTGNQAVQGGGIINREGTLRLEAGSSVTGNTPDNCFGDPPATGTCG